MNFGRMIKIKLDKVSKDEYPVAVAINDRYIVFERQYLEIEEEKAI